ncbi:MAG TPA: class I SAM-dependent methyltransferase [Acidimicrobiales bacterium]|nr:class I SAM-dependent methyltransferase [Acidimicrobiales bacterium]
MRSEGVDAGRGESGNGLVASQIAYYRAHAPRYDDWWFREGRHDLGDEYLESWKAQIETVRTRLVEMGQLGDVLEFAGGTGNWTRELAVLSNSVTVLDASPEAVAIAREKVSGNVTWEITDIFQFHPARSFDTAFFGFWLSHVPAERFEEFWRLVGRCLRPDGRVFFIDNAHPLLARAVRPEFFDAGWRREEQSLVEGIDTVTDLTTGISTRLAADGRHYRLVKIWREPEELCSQLDDLGWSLEIASTEWAFIYGSGHQRPAGSFATRRMSQHRAGPGGA